LPRRQAADHVAERVLVHVAHHDRHLQGLSDHGDRAAEAAEHRRLVRALHRDDEHILVGPGRSGVAVAVVAAMILTAWSPRSPADGRMRSRPLPSWLSVKVMKAGSGKPGCSLALKA